MFCKNEIYKNTPHIHDDKKYICKECFNLLCDKCKLKHIHHDLLEETYFYSFTKFEIETAKSKLEKFKIFKIFNETVGFNQLSAEIKSFYTDITKYEKDMVCILDENQITLEELIFNMKNLINEESNLQNFQNIKNKDKDNEALLEVFKSFMNFNKIFKSLDLIFENFNNSFDNFSTIAYDLLKLKKLREKTIKKIIIQNNSNLIETIVKGRMDKNNDKFELEEKIKFLNSENNNLIEMNNKLLDEMKQLRTNEISKETQEPNVKKEKEEILINNKFDFKNLNLHNSNEFLNALNKIIIKICITEKDILEIDKIDIKKFIKINFDNLFSQINFKEFNFLKYERKDFFDSIKVKKTVECFLSSEIYLQILDKLKNTLYEESLDYIFNNKYEISSQLNNLFIDYYYLNSQRIKNLKIIDLKSSQINDNDVKSIVQLINCSKITDLYLQNNILSDQGVSILLSKLSSNKLKTIYLNNNNLTAKSLHIFKNILNEKLDLFSNLKIICFENNKINENATKEVSREIKKLLLKVTIYI